MNPCPPTLSSIASPSRDLCAKGSKSTPEAIETRYPICSHTLFSDTFRNMRCVRGTLGKPMRQSGYLVIEIGFRNGDIILPPFDCLFTGNPPSWQQVQPLRPPQSNCPHVLRSHEASTHRDPRISDTRIVGDDNQVPGVHEQGAEAKCVTVDLGNDGFRQVPDLPVQLVLALSPKPVRCRVSWMQLITLIKFAGLFDVRACTESAPRAAQYDDSTILVRAEAVHDIAQLFAEIAVERIQALRAIHGNRRYLVINCEDKNCKLTCPFFSLRRGIRPLISSGFPRIAIQALDAQGSVVNSPAVLVADVACGRNAV